MRINPRCKSDRESDMVGSTIRCAAAGMRRMFARRGAVRSERGACEKCLRSAALPARECRLATFESPVKFQGGHLGLTELLEHTAPMIMGPRILRRKCQGAFEIAFGFFVALQPGERQASPGERQCERRLGGSLFGHRHGPV